MTNIFLSYPYKEKHKGKNGFAFNVLDVDTLKGTTFFHPIKKDIDKLRNKARKILIKTQMK